MVIVTLPVPPVDGLPAGPRAVIAAAPGQVWLIPVPQSVYGAAPVAIRYSGDVDVTSAAYVFIS
jgi:hypothetical protein